MAIKVLEDLASKLVGDGKSPNLFFVSHHDGIAAVFVRRRDAIEYAESSGADLVEDRKAGEIWVPQWGED